MNLNGKEGFEMKKRYDVPMVQISWANETDILRTSNFVDFQNDFGEVEDIYL